MSLELQSSQGIVFSVRSDDDASAVMISRTASGLFLTFSMYVLTASLCQRPASLIRASEKFCLASSEAAPLRKECEVYFLRVIKSSMPDALRSAVTHLEIRRQER